MSDTDPGRRLKLRFIAVTCEEAFFGPVKRGIADAAEMLGVEATFTGSKGVDAAEMCEIARRALDEGVDGLAIDIFDADAFAPVVAEAHARGVPVVAFNINEGNGRAGNLSGIAQDFAAAGKVLGQRAAQAIKPGSKVLITMHDAGLSALEARRDGIKAAFAGLDIDWIEAITGHHPDAAARVIVDHLQREPKIAAVLATGQADTEGAGLAIEKTGQPLFTAGFDLSSEILRLIEAGHLAMTIDQQPYAQGFYPVVQLTLNLRYGLLPVDMDAGAAVIDRSNARQVRALAQTGYR